MINIEETGKNVEEATEKALEQLGVTEDDVDVEILDEGTKGFLGIGQTPAKVRVALKDKPVEAAKPERAPSRRRAPRSRKSAQKQPISSDASTVVEPEQKPEAPISRGDGRGRRKSTLVVAEPERKPEAAPVAPTASEDIIKQAAEIGCEVLQRLLDGIGSGGKATIKSVSDGQVVLDMVGGDVGVLVGKHGQTIDALQYLVGVITNRRVGERVRLIIDAEGYRSRREEALQKQALFLAEKVKQSGQEAVLEALHAGERRIVHTALADSPDVYTYSEGVEPERYVVISPKK